MTLSEFDLIQRYFQADTTRSDVAVGIGDDCAVLRVPAGHELAVSIDTLVQGVHFFSDIDPYSLGHKALAVSLSDLAAMGATPAWVTLALTLPHSDPDWLKAFSEGFVALACAHQVDLVGGDTTRGPLTLSTQAHGFIEQGRGMRRSGARVGDLIYVTGTLGDAGLALRAKQGLYQNTQDASKLMQRLERPLPRVSEGRALARLATAAIDISDGLAADLGHILKASQVGATVDIDRIPLSHAVRAYGDETGDWLLALSAGDDYELCVVVSEERQREVEKLAASFQCGLTRIGIIEQESGLRCRGADGRLLELGVCGFDHFAGYET